MVTYAERPWIKRYDEGVPATLQPYPDHPVHEFLVQGALSHPDHVMTVTSAKLPALGRHTREVTYREINDLSDALATALVKLGLQKGDRVVIVLPNTVQFVISFFAILKAGGVVVAMNPTYPRDKMRDQIVDAGATIAITMSLFYNMVVDMQPETPLKQIIVTNVKEYLPKLAGLLFTIAKEKKEGHAIEKRPQDHAFQDLLKQYAGQKPDVKVTKDDLAIFQYTGGTTGISKAAMATHEALVVNSMMCRAWIFGKEFKNPNAGTRHAFLGAIPMFHVFGLVAVLCTATSFGARIVLVVNPREITEVLDCIDSYRCTIFPGVPALYNAINNHADVKAGKFKLTSIEACISGSAPLPPATKREFERITGGKLVEGFGMSEVPTATHANPIFGENRTGSIGLPFPDMEMKIVSLDDPDEEVPVGEVGELVMHGPHLMRGYYNMPTETHNALQGDANGKLWLYTGDIARMDEDGYFYIVDRKKDMALIGGYNVYPRIVEDVLNEHPAVMEVGVAAIPHPEKPGQEALKAWVVLHEGQQIKQEDLIEFAAKKLARYEVPTRYELVSALPRTTVGKILRRELAEMEMKVREAEAAGQP
ncbi:MAG: long-chain fatty acid--CoA ligase [Anaerolineae bacterium]|nr:long-chain fatty acid--CoA ligase [Anaerolineae bacterium]